MKKSIKSYNPICPNDLQECNHFGEEYWGCQKCDRQHNGVRPTGGMPNLEKFVNWIKQSYNNACCNDYIQLIFGCIISVISITAFVILIIILFNLGKFLGELLCKMV